jgi:hypothetical protein
MSGIIETATAVIQQDPAMRWLTGCLCLALGGAGAMGLFFPHQYRKALLGFLSRAPNQESSAGFIKFVNHRQFILLVRLFSLIPIGIAIAILRTII